MDGSAIGAAEGHDKLGRLVRGHSEYAAKRRRQPRAGAADGLDRFAEIKAKIAEQHGLQPGDQRADMLAGLTLAHERMIEQMAHGRTVDWVAFSRVTELLERHVPPIIPKVQLEFVGPAVTMCPKCEHVFDPETPERTI